MIRDNTVTTDNIKNKKKKASKNDLMSFPCCQIFSSMKKDFERMTVCQTLAYTFTVHFPKNDGCFLSSESKSQSCFDHHLRCGVGGYNLNLANWGKHSGWHVKTVY